MRSHRVRHGPEVRSLASSRDPLGVQIAVRSAYATGVRMRGHDIERPRCIPAVPRCRGQLRGCGAYWNTLTEPGDVRRSSFLWDALTRTCTPHRGYSHEEHLDRQI